MWDEVNQWKPQWWILPAHPWETNLWKRLKNLLTMRFLGPDVISLLRSFRLNNTLTSADVMQFLANHKWIALYQLWQNYIFWMTIHVFLRHYLLYEFILLLHKWLQRFNHFSFEPAQKLNRIFCVHIFPKNYIPIAVDFWVHQSYLSLSSSVKINLSLNLDSALFSHQNLWVFFLCSGLKSNRV